MAKVVIAMSGGVDSSLAAALLVEQGHEVIGMMLRLWAEEGCASNRCCTPESVDDAKMVADQLGIPFYVIDYKARFKEQVVDPFIRTYEQNITPNPCVLCNEHVRFGGLLEEALDLGAEFIATGHYAKITNEKGTCRLFRGLDLSKDQSYVLYRLKQEQLAKVMFPLGEYTKVETRKMAEERGISVADKPDSQDLCFTGDHDYRDFLVKHQAKGIKTGNMVDRAGNILGKHRGLPFYTIGQRRGLGIGGPNGPYFVLSLDSKTNNLVIGQKTERGTTVVHAHDLHFLSTKPEVECLEITAKIRYTSPQKEASLQLLPDNRAQITFYAEMLDVAPGQSIVFYLDDEVIGGGFIEKEN
ncbi:MAG: tRNA 2-thiouridine(34) synthase MnmA [SAR324 cluster bacterium]|nr:tRNA 2-thiouridine(34) synthase MnmA [SAR324 cluster bacterium]